MELYLSQAGENYSQKCNGGWLWVLLCSWSSETCAWFLEFCVCFSCFFFETAHECEDPFLFPRTSQALYLVRTLWADSVFTFWPVRLTGLFLSHTCINWIHLTQQQKLGEKFNFTFELGLVSFCVSPWQCNHPDGCGLLVVLIEVPTVMKIFEKLNTFLLKV